MRRSRYATVSRDWKTKDQRRAAVLNGLKVKAIVIQDFELASVLREAEKRMMAYAQGELIA